jgi:neutral ceramidase
MNRTAWLMATLLTGTLFGADFRAGLGRRQITPPVPIWLAGFAARTHPAESVAHDLWTKALAIEDHRGQKVIVITVDLVKMPRAMIDMVVGRVTHRHGIERRNLLINFSHTHSGPVLDWPADADRAMIHRIEGYRNRVMDAMTEAAAEAVADLRPARISYGTGKVGFSHNRRQRAPGGGFVFGMDPDGPADPTVPVLRITGADGKLRGVLFGLSCHASALTPAFYVVSGDYPGIAQAAFEKAHPGTTALFLQLCGGDQTTYPRGKMELAVQYGEELAGEVDRVMGGPTRAVRAPLKTAMVTTELAFAPFSLEGFEEQAKSSDALLRTHAERMLKQYQSGTPPLPRWPYTVQAIQFGKDLTWLALNGEPVVEYALRAKREYGAEGLVVAGYSNDIPSYIPSERVLREGGYEARDAILMAPLPGPLAPGVEETIFAAVREVMAAVGRERAR